METFSPAGFIQGLETVIVQYPILASVIAVVAGILSTSTCPCTIPAGVGLLGFVGSQVARVPDTRQRQQALRLTMAFLVGLLVSLTALGTAVALLGRVLAQWGVIFALATGTLTLVAGLSALFGPALRRRVADPQLRERGGMGGALLYGLGFSVATLTTSAGPLFLLLVIAAAMGRPMYGAVLALTYAIGRALPFLALGVFASRASGWVVRAQRYHRPAEVISGIALIGLSAYFVKLSLALT